MSEKYSTEDLLAVVGHYRDGRTPSFSDEECDAIIARLRAADRLCEAVSSLSEGYWGFANLHFVARLKKAIAEYEGKKEK